MTFRSVAIVLIAPLVFTVALGQGGETPINFKIAFIGDQGLNSNSKAVLRLILAEGADAVIHAGDIDYGNNPPAAEAMIDSILGPDFPYFIVIGNHDHKAWFPAGGYQDLQEARMRRLGIHWDGEFGVISSFKYQGIFIVFVAPGIFFKNDVGFFEKYVKGEFAGDHSIWRLCVWHKNMEKMQIGGKFDETGWGVYEASRRAGAIIATAHEHSYSRTHLLANMTNQIVASTDNTLQLAVDDPATTLVDEGRSFVFVSGLGGGSIRDQERCFPSTPPYGCKGEWASIYTSDQNASHGALFGTFNYEGDPTLAHFYFKDIRGRVPDQFFVRAARDLPASPTCPADLNHDRVVDLADIMLLFQVWGTSNPEADLNDDGTVNYSDLRMIVTRMGPCPVS